LSPDLSILVAGVRLRAISDRPFDLDEGFPRFVSAGQSDLEVHVRAGRLPSNRGERPVWDSGRGWTVSRRGSDTVLRVRGSSNRHPPAMCVRVPASGGAAEAVLEDDRPLLYNVLSVPVGPVLLIGALHARGGALLHGCGARRGARAWAFPARSGGGKTTLAGNLARVAGTTILSDDTLGLVASGDEWRLCGTPWSGHPEHAAAQQARLVGLGFLRKGRRHGTTPLTKGEATRRLLARLFVPWWLPDGAARALQTARSIAASVDARVATLTPTLAAAQFLVRAFAARESRRSPLSLT